MSLLSMVAGLVDSEVRFVVIGGVAGAAHGSRRVTDDLDICYEPSLENRRRLAIRLGRWHAYPRGIEPGLPFIMDEVTLHHTSMLTLRTDQGDLDCFISVPGVGSYAEVAGSSEPVNVGDVRFRVLTLAALIRAKRAAGRPKDQEALLELEALATIAKPRPQPSIL
ncbi:MAG TPA: hypothetical protein VH113_02670 [Gemmatimonadales bacterium]|nr:hypothetical protein [Gemmatimonadales bacterium]